MGSLTVKDGYPYVADLKSRNRSRKKTIFYGNDTTIVVKTIFVAKLGLLSVTIPLTSVFFKVFERVSWWSLRVSTPFSLLCLILLTDFH